jgi:hypothetical protein
MFSRSLDNSKNIVKKKGLALPPKTPSKHFKEEKEREVCG